MKLKSALFLVAAISLLLIVGLSSCDMLFGTPVSATGTYNGSSSNWNISDGGGTATTDLNGVKTGTRNYVPSNFTVSVTNTKPIRTFNKIIFNGLFHHSVQDLKITLTPPVGSGASILTILTDATGYGSDLADNFHFDGKYEFERNSTNVLTKSKVKDGTTNVLKPDTYQWNATDITIFDGINPQGNWTVTISDGWAGDAGYVGSIELVWYE